MMVKITMQIFYIHVYKVLITKLIIVMIMMGIRNSVAAIVIAVVLLEVQ